MVAVPASAEDYKPMKKDHHAKMEKMMEKVDTDSDGAISRDEYMDMHATRFAEKDLDGDGLITKEEMKKSGEEMRKKWKEKWQDKKEGMKTEGME